MNPVFQAIRDRRAVRRYSAKTVPDDLLLELLELANRAPSGFNLQPWHFIVVRDPNIKKLLSHVAMDQPQVVEAPVTVVFVANSRSWKEPYSRVLELGQQSGSLSERAHAMYKKRVPTIFRTSPLGIFGFGKKIVIPILRLFRPTPSAVTSHQEAIQYVRLQTMIAAATFMIAARGAGLDTSPMEGFDEDRLKRLLNIPSYMSVPIIIPVGYALETSTSPQSVRLSLKEKLSFDLFTNIEQK